MHDPFNTAVRQSIQQVRTTLSVEYQRKASRQLCSRLRQLEAYRLAKRIGLYHAVRGEIDLFSLWTTAPLHGKYCYFPALQAGRCLSFLPATPATAFTTNKFGIAEPDVPVALAAPLVQLDVIIVPLVAFDLQGTRLGMGAGYYDRTLAKEAHNLVIGVAYPFQRVDYLEPKAWDIPMDAVVTPEAVYWCH